MPQHSHFPSPLPQAHGAQPEAGARPRARAGGARHVPQQIARAGACAVAQRGTNLFLLLFVPMQAHATARLDTAGDSIQNPMLESSWVH